MLEGYGLIHTPIYSEEFVKLMDGQGYDKWQLECIYNDIEKRSYEDAEYYDFDIEKIKEEYKVADVIHPRDEREYKEFLDNEELGLRLYDEIIGGFIPNDIKPHYVITGDKKQVLYRIRD